MADDTNSKPGDFDNSDDPQAAAAAEGWRTMLGSVLDASNRAVSQQAQNQRLAGQSAVKRIQGQEPSPEENQAEMAGAQSALGSAMGALSAAPKMINIEHYSPEANLSVLDPAKMGSGVDAYTQGRAVEPKFSFSYRAGTHPEDLVKQRSPYKYTGQVDESSLYDLSNDPEQIATKAIQANQGVKDMSQIAQAVKDAGYKGFITPHPAAGVNQNSVMMFERVPLKKAPSDNLSSSHFIFTPENPRYPTASRGPNPSTDQVIKMLNENGFSAELIKGKYSGDNENSIIVNDVSPHKAESLHSLAASYGQESGLYSKNGHHELRFYAGPNAGKSIYGQGTEFHENVPDDNYSQLKNGTIFTHDLDFNEQPKQSGGGKKFAVGGIVGGSLEAHYVDGGEVTVPQQPQDNTTNVISPQGDLVSIPNEQLETATHPVNGYRIATPEDISNYQREQKYGGLSGELRTAGESALSGATFGAVPGIGPAEDIRARQEVNPISNIVGGIVPYAAEQFVPGAGEAADVGLFGKIGQIATTIPRAIGEAGEAVKSASGLTGAGAKALQYAAEGAIMQGQEEVSKALLKDPEQSATSALVHEGLASLFTGALGMGVGGLGKTADLWESKFGKKVGDAIVDSTIPNLSTQEVISGVDVPPVLSKALEGDINSYNTVQMLMKSDTVGGRAVQKAVDDLFGQMENKTLESIGSEMAEKAPSAYETGEKLRDSILRKIEAGKNVYGPIYDQLRPRYNDISVDTEQKELFAGNLTKAISEAGIGTLEGSQEANAVNNLFKTLDKVSTANDIKNLSTGLNNAAKNPELQRLAAVTGPIIKNFESDTVQTYLTKIAEGSAPKQLAKAADATQAAVNALSPQEAIESAAKLQDKIAGFPQASALDSQKASDLLTQRKVADAAYKAAMSEMNDLKTALGLGRFKGPNGFIRALNEKAPEQIVQRLSNKNRKDVMDLLQKQFPEAAAALRSHMLQEELYDSRLPNGGLNVKKFLNNLLDGSKNPEHIQQMLATPAALPRLNAIRQIAAAIPKDGNPSNSAQMLDKLWRGKVGAMMGGALGVGGGHIIGAVLGDVGDNVMREIRPFLSYKALELRGAGKEIIPGNIKAMYDYAKSVANGHKTINKAIDGIFNQRTVLADSKIPSESDKKKLDRLITEVQKDPSVLTNTAKNLQEIMPDHAGPLAMTAQSAVTYLNSIKPRSPLGLPLDQKVKPDQRQMIDYYRQLSIAQQPAMVLKHISEGTLTMKDVATIRNVHPEAYDQFKNQLQQKILEPGVSIPYKTKLSMSLFLGQPLDSTMTPQGILGAQPVPMQQQPQGGAPGVKAKRSTTSLNKLPGSYKTPGQAAEERRSAKE